MHQFRARAYFKPKDLEGKLPAEVLKEIRKLDECRCLEVDGAKVYGDSGLGCADTPNWHKYWVLIEDSNAALPEWLEAIDYKIILDNLAIRAEFTVSAAIDPRAGTLQLGGTNWEQLQFVLRCLRPCLATESDEATEAERSLE